ncbi:Ficolin-1 [Amphibalanus amphitrite]|uniref:Ficolin-1 n=1 Tax=Amphibalanus amphitrite TaxID=1232801 RepID=A0A6A4VAG6_AMPAM|nr:Ficolin-1 [Amphibalanus amphitrite]
MLVQLRPLHPCDARCVAADLVVTSEGLSCRLAARRGGSLNTTSAVAAFVRVGRAQLGERCLTDAECWKSLEGAGCVDGVCACPAPALTARRDCVISNCSELTALGVTTSGQHWVRLAAGAALTALYCDMETDGGGWTVFQRRQDDTEQVDFYRDWQQYRDGFGNVSGQLWLGNELIHHLTARGPHQLRIDMEDFEGDRRFAQYASFSLADEADNYRLSEVIDEYGLAGKMLVLVTDSASNMLKVFWGGFALAPQPGKSAPADAAESTEEAADSEDDTYDRGHFASERRAECLPRGSYHPASGDRAEWLSRGLRRSASVTERSVVSTRAALPRGAQRTTAQYGGDVMTDLERGTMNALKKAFPAKNMTTCHFHLSKALYGKVVDLGLKPIWPGISASTAKQRQALMRTLTQQRTLSPPSDADEPGSDAILGSPGSSQPQSGVQRQLADVASTPLPPERLRVSCVNNSVPAGRRRRLRLWVGTPLFPAVGGGFGFGFEVFLTVVPRNRG